MKLLPNYLSDKQIKELWILSKPDIREYPGYHQYVYKKDVRPCPKYKAITAFNQTQNL